MAALIFFPDVSWGVAKGVPIFDLYGKGTGQLFFSLINIYLWCLFFGGVIVRSSGSKAYRACNIKQYFWAYNILFLGYIIYGISTGITPDKILSQKGVINIFNMSLITLLMIRLIASENEIRRFTDFFLICVFSRGIFGFIRFAFMGGDIANVYQNTQNINITITFFDINDSLLASMAAFFSAWMLMFNLKSLSRRRRIFYFLLIVLELFIIIFSYRRTSWGGLLLAGMLFGLLQPVARRITVMFGIGLMAMIMLATVVVSRFAKFSGGKGNEVINMLFYDVKPSLESGRFSELYQAFQTIKKEPLFSVGPWGGYGPHGLHDFMHSGLIHVWLKSGLFGLLLFLAIFFGFILFVFRHRKQLSPAHRGWYESGLAGILFMIPTIAMGTPIIEFRTMQLLGITLALPYIAYGIYGNRSIQNNGKVRKRYTFAEAYCTHNKLSSERAN